MTQTQDYVLGQSALAARRLEIQHAHFAETSERLLDQRAILPADRGLYLGCWLAGRIWGACECGRSPSISFITRSGFLRRSGPPWDGPWKWRGIRKCGRPGPSAGRMN